LENPVGDQTAKCGGQEGRPEEDGQPETELASSIEEGQEEDYTGEEAGLTYTILYIFSLVILKGSRTCIYLPEEETYN
jgi:hypothetical protein